MKHWKLDIYKTVLFWDIKWVVQRLVLHGCSKRSYVVFSETFLRYYQVSLRLDDFWGVLVGFLQSFVGFWDVFHLFSEKMYWCCVNESVFYDRLYWCFLIYCIVFILKDCIAIFWWIVLLFSEIALVFSDELYWYFLRDCSGVFEQFRYWCFIKDCFYRLQLFFEIFHWCFLKKIYISVFSETICIFTKRCFWYGCMWEVNYKCSLR